MFNNFWQLFIYPLGFGIVLESMPGVDFINILRARFLYEILAPKISTQSTGYVQKFGNKNSLSYKKRASKKLMKLTAGSQSFPFVCLFSLFWLIG